jgi:hypothetical protein
MLIMSPKKKSDRHKARRITLRLPNHELDLMLALAEREDRTLTAELLRAIRRHLKAENADPSSPKSS